ncbi:MULTISPECIES: putative phage abortive infection protein [unclassified Sulfuricurvum]|uniref:putative phage abortive infection protein n=1 Tax=unclassified Sulfuricurvum TaxID=2632390 RepID=UPI00056A4F0F|nr:MULTISPECIES: putative phage abortive infection protein [unclassified Sulfuricurvum]
MKNLSILLIGGVLFTVLLYAGLLIYLTWPISELSISNSGVFGDSFGLLTSLFSGLAFAGLIITIVMQKKELALQREELSLTREELSGQKQEMQAQNETLKVQRFENTFFKMLELLEACRNDVFYQSNNVSYKGRDAIKALYEKYIKWFLGDYVSSSFAHTKWMFKEDCKAEEGIVQEYNKFYKQYGDELGQYYRTLYNILKLVERAEFLDDKMVYTNLVRAQLSRYELSLLFYNCLSDYGKEKMAPLVKKYKILKHLEFNVLPNENIDIWNEFNAE